MKCEYDQEGRKISSECNVFVSASLWSKYSIWLTPQPILPEAAKLPFGT